MWPDIGQAQGELNWTITYILFYVKFFYLNFVYKIHFISTLCVMPWLHIITGASMIFIYLSNKSADINGMNAYKN